MQRLEGGLYLVSTPIGNSRDMTLRSIDVLGEASLLVAEDTRSLLRLMSIHGIQLNGRSMISYHDFSSSRKLDRVIRELKSEHSVALVAEAGTPLISDPGFKLVRAAIHDGLPVIPIPGPTALIAALTISGLAPDQFHFAGFLPSNESGRKKLLEDLRFAKVTLIFFEAPSRVRAAMQSMAEIFGEDRKAAICRELTKVHEETVRGSLGELSALPADKTLKGEIVIIVDRCADSFALDDIDDVLALALERKSLKEAVAEVSAVFGVSRKIVYKKALMLSNTE